VAPLAQLDPSTLSRIIEDVVARVRPQLPSNITVEELVVRRLLTVSDEVEFTAKPNYYNVGTTAAAAFANSWVNYGGGFAPAAYWKDPLGFVHLRGLIKDGTVGSAAFQLPPGLRPSVVVLAPVISADALGRIEVRTNGDVVPMSPSVNTWVSLDTINFKTA
jgi:hypothetical protein